MKKVHIFHGKNHFNESDGFTEVPELLEEVLRIENSN